MSQYTIGNRVSRKSTADLSPYQYAAVKLDSNSQAVLATSPTDQVIGFVQNAPIARDTADIAVRNGSGTLKARAGGAFSVGQKLTIDTLGRVVYIGATPTTGQEIVGIAFEAATALGQVVEIAPLYDRV